MIADLDTLIIALYVELTDRVIPTLGTRRRGPGRPLEVTDAELVAWPSPRCCCATTTSATGCGLPHPGGTRVPRLVGQSEYNQRLKARAPLLEAALRWLAEQTPGSAEQPRLLDGTPVGCGQSMTTAKRSCLFGSAGYGYEPAHSRFHWSIKLLVVTADGTVTGFGLANPELMGERQTVRQLLTHQPANRPPAGSAVVTDKGLAGEGTEELFAGLELALVRPARRDEHDPGGFPNWLRQRVEAIIWTLEHQLGLEDHGGRVPRGLWARIVQRLLALNAAIWDSWAVGAPVKRSLIADNH